MMTGGGLRLLLVGLLALVGAGMAIAGPLARPGDARMRQDVELLKSFGYIQGPVDAWPLPWAQIEDGIAAAREAGNGNWAVRMAVDRLEALARLNGERGHYEVSASGTNDPALVRGFAATARNPGEASISADHNYSDSFSFTWGATWVSDGVDRQRATQHGNGFSPAPSQAVLKLGNWALYGGWQDIYWGSGIDGALLFSTSARSFPRVGIRRLRPYSIDAPVLRWLGPVTGDFFVGVLDEKREYDNPMVIGMRFAFQPTPYFEIGLQRGLMLCGAGRPCSLSKIGNALIGIGNADNTGTLNEPGNQIGGFEMAYRRPIGRSGHALRLSFEAVGEDADNIVIEQFARQVGVAFLGPAGDSGGSYLAGVEFADTLGQRFLGSLQGGDLYIGSIYNHFIYTDGWTYGRRPLGFSIDGDSRMLTVHGSVTDTTSRRWYASYRHVDLNLYAYHRYRISQTHEKIHLVTAGVDWPTRIGDLRVEARVQKNGPDTPDSSPWRLQGEVGWTSRF